MEKLNYVKPLLVAIMLCLYMPFGDAAGLAASSDAESIYNQISEYQLENGMTVLVLPRRDLPILSLQIWYKSGSANEVEGASGIAHFLEHMYSMGTKNYGPREIDRLVRSVGGQKNASTSSDYTRYFVNIPSNELEKFVAIEAERMSGCTFPEDKILSERNTVAEERRMRNEDDQGGVAYEKLMEMVYAGHAYAHPTVGYMDDIQGYDYTELASYYDSNYHPDNAVVVIVGDVEPDSAFEVVKKHFAPLPCPARLVNYPDDFETTQTAEKRLVIEHPSPLPLILIGWPTVRFGADESVYLDLVSEILAGGRSGRLYTRLVRNDRIATSVSTGQSDRRVCGMFVARINVGDVSKVDPAEKAIYEEIERVVADGVGDAELAAAKKRLLANEVYGMQSNEGLARAIGWTAASGDWQYLLRYPEIVAGATADDIARVASTYLIDKTRSVVVVLPKTDNTQGGGGAGTGEPELGDSSDEYFDDSSGNLVFRGARSNGDFGFAGEGASVEVGFGVAAEGDSDKPLVEWDTLKLDNGLHAFLVEREGLPMVACELRVNAGAMYDLPGKEGLANLTAAMMRQGSLYRGAEEIDALLDARGALLSASAGADYASFTLVCLLDDFPEMLSLLGEMLLNPAFAQDEFARAQTEWAERVKRSYGQGATLARDAFYEAVFPHNGYRNPTDGKPASIAALTCDDLIEFYGRHYNPSQTQLTVVGPVNDIDMLALAHEAFGQWAGERVEPFKLDDRAGAGDRVIIVDMQANQANVRIGHGGLPIAHRDFFKLRFANEILGANGMTSRLGDAVRNQRGLSYSVYSWTSGFRDAGAFFATFSTKIESTREAVNVSLDVISGLLAAGPTDEELALAKAAMLGSNYFRIESFSGVTSAVAEANWSGLGAEYFERMIDDVKAMDAGEVRRVLAEYVKPQDFVIVVAGPADALASQFEDMDVTVVKMAGAG